MNHKSIEVVKEIYKPYKYQVYASDSNDVLFSVLVSHIVDNYLAY